MKKLILIIAFLLVAVISINGQEIFEAADDYPH